MKQRTRTIYEKRTSDELRALVSRKKVALAKLAKLDGFFVTLEKEKLESQIKKIEVELTLRFYQPELPLK